LIKLGQNNIVVRFFFEMQCITFLVSCEGTMVQSLAWNDENNMLAALTDGKLNIYYYPNVAYVDRSLLPRTVYERDAAYVNLLSCYYGRILNN